MNHNYENLRHHFENNEFDFEGKLEEHVIVSEFQLENTYVRVRAYADPDQDQFNLSCFLPTTVPEARRAAAGEFLHRINHGLNTGCFHLDPDDGELRFYLGLPLEPDHPLTDGIITRCIVIAATTVDGFHPALMKVIYAHMTPSQAVEQGEAHLATLLNARRRAST